MPVYLFTLHAYRSWNADHRRGYVRRGQGIQEPDAARAKQYDRAAKQLPAFFGATHQQVLLSMAYDACQRREWHLHCFASEPTHIHLLVSWKQFQPWEEVRAKLKNLLSLQLGRQFKQRGRRWLVGDGSRKQVRDRKHFDYLMMTYLPRHGGLLWRDSEAPPPAPAGG
jgi:hypothetical protein